MTKKEVDGNIFFLFFSILAFNKMFKEFINLNAVQFSLLLFLFLQYCLIWEQNV